MRAQAVGEFLSADGKTVPIDRLIGLGVAPALLDLGKIKRFEAVSLAETRRISDAQRDG